MNLAKIRQQRHGVDYFDSPSWTHSLGVAMDKAREQTDCFIRPVGSTDILALDFSHMTLHTAARLNLLNPNRRQADEGPSWDDLQSFTTWIVWFIQERMGLSAQLGPGLTILVTPDPQQDYRDCRDNLRWNLIQTLGISVDTVATRRTTPRY